jgi:hypothetical protein
MGKLVVAALVGGLIVFAWGAIAHMATPLGMAGMSFLPDEGATIEGLRVSVPKTGMYIFPTAGMNSKNEAEQKAWTEKYRRGPSGIIVYKAEGTEPLSARYLVVEFISNVFAAFVAALVVSMIPGPYSRRVFAVFLFSIFAFLSLSVSYWNWYSYPATYIGAELVTEGIGWLLAGLAIARLAPGRLLPVSRAAAAA